MVVVNTLYLTEPIRHFLGRESRQEFLRRECESFPTLEWLNARDEVVGVLLVGLKRPYYLEKPGYFGAFADPPVVERLTAGATSPDDVAERLVAAGVSHVVVNRDEYRSDHDERLFSWPDQQRQAFEAFLAGRCTPVFRSGPETVYEMARATP